MAGWRTRIAAIVLGAGIWCQSTPAWALGSYAHGLIAERAYGQLTPQHPWLAAHREAFVWGALAPDLAGPADGPAGRRALSPATLKTLWRAAAASGDRGARAFVLGWAVHAAAEETFGHAMQGERLQALRGALAENGRELPRDLTPLIDFAVDAALVPVGAGTLGAIYRSVAVNTVTPAGAPMRAMLRHVLAIDEAAYLGWAQYQVALSAGGPDRYLEGQSRSNSLQPWVQPLQSAAARQALGDLRPLVTQAVTRGLLQAEDLLAADAKQDRQAEHR